MLFHRARPEFVQSALERMIDVARQVAGRYPGTGVGLSVGVVRFPVAPPCVEEMLKAADGAMYRAKRAGKGRIVVDWAAEQASVFEAPVPVPENT